jgi:hypothetical protein
MMEKFQKNRSQLKDEEFIDTEEETSPVQITFPVIKAECEVSCVCLSKLLSHTFHKYPVLCVVFLISTLVNGI